jgi:3-phosphoshikimate 1-carboxyvinyltransferase
VKLIRLHHTNAIKSADIELPASKSESNRVLILKALSDGQNDIINVSEARDTKIMTELLNSKEKILNAKDAGTVMRFMTAYLAITTTEEIILTGTPRMKQRPIGILVDALESLGANIKYEEAVGFPPLSIRPFSGQQSVEIEIRGDISSQYISALIMIAPFLPDGIIINLIGKIGSLPYIQMTLDLLKEIGISYTFKENRIDIPAQKARFKSVEIESDWSAASYWYAFLTLSENLNKIHLKGLRKNSRQGDSILVSLFANFGIDSCFDPAGLTLLKNESEPKSLRWDFSNCPDLAQTVSVVCAAKGIDAVFTGLESLRIKETDRIKALDTELSKFGCRLVSESSDKWKILGKISAPEEITTIETYHDHRMAMSFAPLSSLFDVKIRNPEVVNKSYPNFWNELKKVGIQISPVNSE